MRSRISSFIRPFYQEEKRIIKKNIRSPRLLKLVENVLNRMPGVSHAPAHIASPLDIVEQLVGEIIETDAIPNRADVLGCASYSWGGNIDESRSVGEIRLPYLKMQEMKLSDDTIAGIIAHEFAHHYHRYNYGKDLYTDGQDLEDEIDQIASDWGFENEIRRMRKELGHPHLGL